MGKLSFILVERIVFPLGKTKKILFGLGWDPTEAGNQVDLDANVHLSTRIKLMSEKTIYFGRKTYNSHDAHDNKKELIRHCGDNLTGQGECDDKQIILDIDKINRYNKKIRHLTLSITSYSGCLACK